MKTAKRIFSLFLALSLTLTGLTFTSSAEEPETGADYPYILVHGMMGWGDNDKGQHEYSYWGMKTDGPDIETYLESKGHETYAPTVSPMGSAWDRACELYAQLTGTVVDYGKAHSEKAGHARYGRDYTGKAIMGEPWDLSTKINLISHSFGGPTVTVFTSLLGYGSEEERLASPDDCSELFKGGHGSSVYSVSTLDSPHNGTTLANVLNDTVAPVFLVSFIMNLLALNDAPSYDWMIDQWGLSVEPGSGEKAKFNLCGIIRLATSNDHVAADMTLRGAAELNEKFPPVDSVYYYSYCADMMEENSLGAAAVSDEVSGNPLAVSAKLVAALAYLPIEGKIHGKEWAHNDGLVPVASARCPANAEEDSIVWQEGMTPVPGVWYQMPVWENGSHGSQVSGIGIYGFYDGLISVVASAGTE